MGTNRGRVSKRDTEILGLRKTITLKVRKRARNGLRRPVSTLIDMHFGGREVTAHSTFIHVTCSTFGKQLRRLASSPNVEKVMSEMCKVVTLTILGENNTWKRGGIGMNRGNLGKVVRSLVYRLPCSMTLRSDGSV